MTYSVEIVQQLSSDIVHKSNTLGSYIFFAAPPFSIFEEGEIFFRCGGWCPEFFICGNTLIGRANIHVNIAILVSADGINIDSQHNLSSHDVGTSSAHF